MIDEASSLSMNRTNIRTRWTSDPVRGN